MLSQASSAGRRGERHLIDLYRSLERDDRSTLLAFGEFLAARGAEPLQDEGGPLDPKPVPRPRTESVVGAIKRLSDTFYMLDRSAMLNDTSSLMGAHVLRGRPANAVIDELEALFARHYEKYREEKENKDA